MNHFLNALKRLATPAGATLIEAMQADMQEADASMERQSAEARARFEQHRDEQRARVQRIRDNSRLATDGRYPDRGEP